MISGSDKRLHSKFICYQIDFLTTIPSKIFLFVCHFCFKHKQYTRGFEMKRQIHWQFYLNESSLVTICKTSLIIYNDVYKHEIVHDLEYIHYPTISLNVWLEVMRQLFYNFTERTASFQTLKFDYLSFVTGVEYTTHFKEGFPYIYHL